MWEIFKNSARKIHRIMVNLRNFDQILTRQAGKKTSLEFKVFWTSSKISIFPGSLAGERDISPYPFIKVAIETMENIFFPRIFGLTPKVFVCMYNEIHKILGKSININTCHKALKLAVLVILL